MTYPFTVTQVVDNEEIFSLYVGERGEKEKKRLHVSLAASHRVFPCTNEVSLSLRCSSDPPFTRLTVSLTCMEDLSHTLTLHKGKKKQVVMR